MNHDYNLTYKGRALEGIKELQVVKSESSSLTYCKQMCPVGRRNLHYVDAGIICDCVEAIDHTCKRIEEDALAAEVQQAGSILPSDSPDFNAQPLSRKLPLARYRLAVIVPGCMSELSSLWPVRQICTVPTLSD
jgi:hypothetical protein